MRLQKEVQFFNLTLFIPGIDDLLAVLDTDALDLGQALRLLLDDRQRLLAKVFDDALGLLRANTLNQARTEIARDALGRGGQALGETDYAQLATIFGVLFPFPFDR